ncbi:MAG: protein kinase [Symploca sp. SIO2B6]|nr:protein kinase [Symploca sp. SIO2B6]
MSCCLNPDCQNPHNPDGAKFCHSCGMPLVQLQGHYRIIRLLSAQGGFGRTYIAEDTHKLNECCVVKQLAPKNRDPWVLEKSIQLFEQEARRLQLLGEHTQIPTMFAYFEQEQHLYLVQQYIEGQTLVDELKEYGTFSSQEIREFLFDFLGILQFVHQHGVIHRDIKPDNIIRRHSDHKLVLIDFGIAKQLSATIMSQTGTTVGSFGYVPIEQMEGGKVYPASDLYSLGATCFHLLTSIHPWQLWKTQGYGWVAHWREHVQEPLDNALGKVLNRLLQENYQQRYQSVEEVLEDLSIESQRGPVLSPARFFWTQSHSGAFTDSFTKRHKLKKTLLIGGSILLVGFGGYGVWQLKTHFLNTDFITFNKLKYDLAAIRKLQPVAMSIAISPDGKTLVSGDDQEIKIWNLSPWKLKQSFAGHAKWVLSLAISPDGKTLASGGQDWIQIWNLSTGKVKNTLINRHNDEVIALAISPDGQMLVSGSRDKTINIWDLKTGELKHILTGHMDQIFSLAISPDGQTLASGSRDRTIKLWNLHTGELKTTLVGHTATINSLVISPDEQTLVSGSKDTTIKLWNLNTGKLKSTLLGHTRKVNSLAISPDGQIVASGSQDRSVKIWKLSTGKLKLTLDEHNDEVIYVAITPDGQTLVSGSYDGTIKMFLLLD